MQQTEPYVIPAKKRAQRRYYPVRFLIAVSVLSCIAVGVVLWRSYVPARITLPAGEYCLVGMGEYDDLAAASVRAEEVARAGGAGYLYGASPYRVVAACYASLDDARTVTERLNAAGEEASVITVQYARVRLTRPKQNADVLKKMLCAPQERAAQLESLCRQASAGELRAAAAKYAAKKLSEGCASDAAECARLSTEAGDYLASLLLSISDAAANAGQDGSAAALQHAYVSAAVKICAQTEEFIKKEKEKA